MENYSFYIFYFEYLTQLAPKTKQFYILNIKIY